MARLFGSRAVVGVGLLLAACGGEGGKTTPGQMAQSETAGGKVALTGAGSTFDAPVFTRWFQEYAQSHPVQINYQSIGSGAGIRQFTEGTVDFGASDAPMTDEQLAKVPGAMNLPVILGSVAITYNLPGVQQPIRLTGDALVDIFLGKIKKWNDPRLAALNPGVPLPDKDILVVHRSDGSGTSYVFTDYLSTVSPAWKAGPGKGTAVAWPTGLGGKGSEGVTGQVKQTEGAIGYVEQSYAMQNQLPTASIRNRAGAFVQPTIDATTAAAAQVAQQLQAHPDFRLSIVDAPGADAYPIAAWSYVLVRSHMDDCPKAKALSDAFRWALAQGDEPARRLGYAPLPQPVKDEVTAKLKGMTCGPSNTPVSG